MSMLALLVLLQTPAASAATIDDAGTITVTATRLEDLAIAAQRCERGGCPTREDIATSVGYASALFDEGEYLVAKKLLSAAVRRNRGAARAEPLAVAQLFTAQATLASHEGDQETMRRATWAVRNVLTDAPGVPTLSRLTAELRLADWHLRVGDRVAAEARFARIADEARAEGLATLADVAEMRRAVALATMGRRSESRVLLEKLAARTGPEAGDIRRAALATAGRLAFVKHDTAAADGYAARVAAIAPGAEPVLVSAPPLPKPGQWQDGPANPFSMEGSESALVDSDFVGLRWVDIGFRIRPDGNVDDVAIVRSSPRPDWAQPLLTYIGGRRYSAFAPMANADRAGRYHVERYTMTADYFTPKGSLIRRRVANPRFEMMEMSTEAPTG